MRKVKTLKNLIEKAEKVKRKEVHEMPIELKDIVKEMQQFHWYIRISILRRFHGIYILIKKIHYSYHSFTQNMFRIIL